MKTAIILNNNMEKPNPTLLQRSSKSLLAMAAAITLGLTAVTSAVVPQERAHAAVGSNLNIISLPVVIDGKRMDLPGGILNGSSFIGLRALSDQLGWITIWHPSTHTITVSGRDQTWEMDLNSGGYQLNKQVIYGMPPILQKGSTYVPLRFVLERMGYAVSYNAASHEIGVNMILENKLAIENQIIEDKGPKRSLLVNYPQIAGWADQKVQKKVNAFLQKEAESHLTSANNELKKIALDNAAAEAQNLDITIPAVIYEGRYSITYNELNRLSLYVDYYIFTGGAHGGTVRVPYTFDLTTGDTLTLQEAAKNDPHYVEKINQTILKIMKARDLFLNMPFITIEPDRDFFLKHDALVIYFGQYEYTPYAGGMPEFEIPFSVFH